MAQHDVWRPDLILTNGRVLTMDRSDTVVEAVAIKDDRILAVGSTGEIDALAGSGTERLDLHGRTALPGLADIHVHLASDAAQAFPAQLLREQGAENRNSCFDPARFEPGETQT